MAGGMNSLGRLNEILFDELERLNALDVSDKDAVAAECSRSKAIQNVAREINGVNGHKVEYWDRESLEVAITVAKISRARQRVVKAAKGSRS